MATYKYRFDHIHCCFTQLMIDLLQGKSSSHAKASARQMDKDERDKRLTVLRQQRDSWKESSAEYRASQHALHIRVLQEGNLFHFYFTNSESRTECSHLIGEKKHLAKHYGQSITDSLYNPIIKFDLIPVCIK